MFGQRQMQRAFAHDPCRVGDRVPFGAVPAGTKVQLVLRVDPSAREGIKEVFLEIFDEGADHAFAEVDYQNECSTPTKSLWHRISMEPCDAGYQAFADSSGNPRILYYRFRAVTNSGDIVCGRRIDANSTVGEACLVRADLPEKSEPEGFQLTVYDSNFETPAWFSGSVMYQIFPDRFSRDSQGIRSSGVSSHQDRGWPVVIHENWNESPLWQEPYDPVDFFGGTLAGIQEKLDYIESLGVEVIYINPVCEARSNHRYNTGDYEAIDPILGDWDEFEKLASEAAKRGIGIVLDTVLSHTGAASLYFNADNSYDSSGAAQSDASPYRSWYDFSHHCGNVPYRCWWGDATLPEVNEHDASWQNYMLADEGVLAQWLCSGASGLRLDVADEIPDDVLERIRESAKRTSPESIIIGEVWEDPTTKESYGCKRTYALGKSLDSVMNYPLRDALIQFAFGNKSAQELSTFLKMQKSNYPAPLYRSLMNLLSSHDVERIRSVLDLGMEFRGLPREEQVRLVESIQPSDDARGNRMQRILATLIYMLPGVPCLYYGDERGMQGGRDPFDRATFPWDVQRDDCGKDLSDFYKRLGELRRDSVTLRDGNATFYSFRKDIICILRTLDSPGGNALLCVANRSDHDICFAVDLFDPAAGVSSDDAKIFRYETLNPVCIFSSEDFSQGNDAECEDGVFSTCIGGMQAAVFRLSSKDVATEDGAAAIMSSSPSYRQRKLPAYSSCKEKSAAVRESRKRFGNLGRTLERGVGIICHITSIPNDDDQGNSLGFGTMGDPAKRFVDTLAEHGVKYWQILPLNPTDEFGSPYAGLSAFAGNTRILSKCHTDIDEEELANFIDKNRKWLLPYATFTAIKEICGEMPWQQWPEEYRYWNPELADHPLLSRYVLDECRNQYIFEREWHDLRSYANSKGIQIIGDMPIYVSADSADVWSHREYFSLDHDGNVASQGGVPPDQFAAEGQLWGNPTYDWDILQKNGYDWWMQRFKRMFELYDYVRLDHFLGFSAYYSIPAGKSAAEGEWVTGPRIDLFAKAFEEFGPLPMIAEDLGIITPDVQHLLANTGFPGMDVILFADGDPRYDWRPKDKKLVFTGTHDTSTLVGWALKRYCSDDDSPESLEKARQIARELEDKAIRSDADVIMLPLQDVLELDDDARMNIPGTVDHNWEWQAAQKDIDSHLKRLNDLTEGRR